MMSKPFILQNKHRLDVLGDTHVPLEAPKACVIIVHGFKGYKDYGFIPVLAHDLCESGVLVHRFNTSTSGMTNDLSSFARPDLFAMDTWNRQVDDVLRVLQAVRDGEIKGDGLPLYLVGHSRGGATVLLTAGRHSDALNLSSIITINAVDRCCRMSEDDQHAMIQRGYTMTTSARTNQNLRIDASWLQEQLDDPDAHDVLSWASKIQCDTCILHGDADDAVDISAGQEIAKACGTSLQTLAGANHVLNMSNPFDLSETRSEPFLETLGAITRLITKQSKN